MCRRLYNKKSNSTQKKEEVPLRGVLRCFCGKLVTAGNSRSKSGKFYWYYLCREHRNNLPANKLHQQFNEMLDALSMDDETADWFRDQLHQKISAMISEKGENVRRVEQNLKQGKK